MTRLRPSLGARLAARVVTGPLGHLWGGACDWVELLARYGWARASTWCELHRTVR